MGRIWALCMGKNSHRYIFCVAHCPQEHSFIFKIAFPRFLHSWKPLALLWAKMRLFSSPRTTPQPFGLSPSNFVACLATLLRLAKKYPSSLQCLAWCPQCNTMPKVHHQAMGCPYWPPSLHFFWPAGHGVPCWRSGNARARCACLRTPLGSCAARVRRAAETAAPAQQTTAECATAGATSTNATGRRRVAGCDVHVSHSCAGAQAARSHVHESLKLSSLIESKCTA